MRSTGPFLPGYAPAMGPILNVVFPIFAIMAAGYAAAGRFDEAVRAADRALEIADAQGQADLYDDIRRKRELYRSGRAYVSPSKVEGG